MKVQQPLENKHQVIDFMAKWPPARAFVENETLSNGATRALSYDHLDNILALSKKPSLTPEDHLCVKQVLSFLDDHRESLSPGLFESLAQASARPGTLRSISDALATQFITAISTIKEDLDHAPYRQALQTQFENF